MELNSKIWIPCEQNVWVRGTLLDHLDEDLVRVETESGVVTISKSKVAKIAALDENAGLPLCNDLEVNGMEDMCNLNHLHEPAILENLQVRFEKSMPYTYTGSICIAVNPYKWLPGLYDKESYGKYLTMEKEELAPHPFALSSKCYLDMTRNQVEQSILVSGESGAGKTETVKVMMNHLASISGGGKHGDTTIEKVLKSNPLLESFGNAKTKRNDNSSRFGKFAQLQFDPSGHLIGARCETYLLEKSRVVGTSLGERNYHIFYQLLSLGQDQLAEYKLSGQIQDYEFVKNGSFTNIDGISDRDQFQRTTEAMTTIGMSQQEQESIFQVVASILHLGEIKFSSAEVDEKQVSRIDDKKPFEAFSSLLQIGAQEMENILCYRSIVAGTECYDLPLNVTQALELRDAFAKGIYSYMFDWLVRRINLAICSDAKVQSHIGLLDIFGFESFEHNSFEQLCINYTNEKLQQKFNHDIFKVVQTEYVQEEIPLSLVTFQDNQPILDLIEGKMGIVDLLNEEVVRPMATDASFVRKVLDKHSEHSNLECPKFDDMTFVIRHYAGAVAYDGTGFLEKNRDNLPIDLIALLSSSASSLISQMFTTADVDLMNSEKFDRSSGVLISGKSNANARRGRGYLIGNTIAAGFRKQLSELLETIDRTSVQYIRCIKPNDNKSATEFDRNMIADQLRCAGVISAIQISRASFPNRITLEEFQRRFEVLAPNKLHGLGAREFSKGLLRIVVPDESESTNKVYAIGKSKIFFSAGLLQQIEAKRAVLLHVNATRIQKMVRGYHQRKRYVAVKNGTIKTQALTRSFQARKRFLRQQSSIVMLQSTYRGFSARKLLQQDSSSSDVNDTVVSKNMNENSSEEEVSESSLTKVDMTPRDTAILTDDLSSISFKSWDDGDVSQLSVAERVKAAEGAAREAQSAVATAMQYNKKLERELKDFREKRMADVAKHADAEILKENERLKQQVSSLQTQLMRAQEVSLISAVVIDTRKVFRDGSEFVEFKVKIESDPRGTLYVWHKYNTFRNLASTLQSKNGYRKKDIPNLPHSSLRFSGKFSEKLINERIERLNAFLDAAAKADYLQWGIRIDETTCVYKRRVRNSSAALSAPSRESNDGLRRSIRNRFSFRRSQAA